MIPLSFFQIFIIVQINNIWVYPYTLSILLNQGAISELKARTQKKLQIPHFKGTFHLEWDLFLSCTALIVILCSEIHSTRLLPKYFWIIAHCDQPFVFLLIWAKF